MKFAPTSLALLLGLAAAQVHALTEPPPPRYRNFGQAVSDAMRSGKLQGQPGAVAAAAKSWHDEDDGCDGDRCDGGGVTPVPIDGGN